MSVPGTTGSIAEAAPSAIDLDDMFGVRRALESLPDHLWDEFFSTWGEIADACALDVERMQALAAIRATSPEGAAARDHLARAQWVGARRTVSDAMGSYLLWRAQRNAATAL